MVCSKIFPARVKVINPCRPEAERWATSGRDAHVDTLRDAQEASLTFCDLVYGHDRLLFNGQKSGRG